MVQAPKWGRIKTLLLLVPWIANRICQALTFRHRHRPPEGRFKFVANMIGEHAPRQSKF